MTSVEASSFDARSDEGEQTPNPVVRAWRAFKIWRRSRPFWGGLLTLFAALELWSLPFMFSLIFDGTLNLQVGGVAGLSTIMITPMMAVMALTMWFFPTYRVFAGVATIVMAIVCLPVSNFGGFLLGTLLGIFGGGLAFSWAPELTEEQIAARQRAAEAYRLALEGEAPALTVANAGTGRYDGFAEPYQPFLPHGAAVASDFADDDSAAAPSPLADTLKQQRTAIESEATPSFPAQLSQDEVPALPAAEDTPMGA